jgi:hypothetical protein
MEEIMASGITIADEEERAAIAMNLVGLSDAYFSSSHSPKPVDAASAVPIWIVAA